MNNTKICKKCGKEKSLEEFGTRKSGKINIKLICKGACKECEAIYHHNHRLENVEHYVEYSKKWYAENKEHDLARKKAYYQTVKGKASLKNCAIKYRNTINGDLHSKARVAVNHAVARGKLIPPTACSKCFKECRPEAHHTDYTKPLEITWLCHECHLNERE